MRLVRIHKQHCNNKTEEDTIFAVIEDYGDKIVIAPVNCRLPIVPTEQIQACMAFDVGNSKGVNLPVNNLAFGQ